jgi:pimeloyl-ACP methyl ester carboxylesterase
MNRLKIKALLVTGFLILSACGGGSGNKPLPIVEQNLALTDDKASFPEPPLISGTSGYTNGEYVWTDYAYDDRGGNTNLVAGGDGSYPASPYPGNTADFIQLRFATTVGGAVTIRAVLNSLIPGSDALIGVGFDTDNNAATGAKSLPGNGLGSDVDPLGLEVLVLMPSAGEEGTLLVWDGTKFFAEASFNVISDPESNVIDAIVASLVPGQESWNAVGVVGVVDESGSWRNGAHPIMDLAFVVGEEPLYTGNGDDVITQLPGGLAWQERNQSEVLAGNRPVADAVALIEFGTERTEIIKSLPLGYHTFMYRSEVDFGGGVDNSGTFPVLKGAFQPYVAMLHSPWTTSDELRLGVLYLHGVGGNHISNPGYFAAGIDREWGVRSSVYDISSTDAVVLFVTGRNLGGWSFGDSELDALEVLKDATARLRLDAEQIVLSGNSMGGYGTYDLASRYPDRFTGAYPIVGFSDGDPGSVPFDNYRNIPMRAHNGAYDPLVNYATYIENAEKFAAASLVDYRIVLVQTGQHSAETEGSCWYEDLLSRPRVVNPGAVDYTLTPDKVINDEVSVVANSAYWVSMLTARGDTPARIVATSHNLAQRVLDEQFDLEDENITKGADFCGPNPEVMNNDRWHLVGRSFAETDVPNALANGFDLRATELAEASFDLDRMAIDAREPITLSIVTDGPLTLTFRSQYLDGDYQSSCEGNSILSASAEHALSLIFYDSQSCEVWR